MLEFFKGWRRKAGCIALVTACVFAIGWMRSQFIEDSFHVHDVFNECFFGSTKDGIYFNWLRFGTEDSGSLRPSETIPFWLSVPRNAQRFGGVDELAIDWDWTWLGFRYLGATVGFIAIVPYWSIVLPTTLLSAYLILWKPRKREPGPTQR